MIDDDYIFQRLFDGTVNQASFVVTTEDEMEVVEITLSAHAVAFYKEQARMSEVDDWRFHLENIVNVWAEEQGE